MTEMFLGYRSVTQNSNLGESILQNKELTDHYRQLVGSIAPNDEAQAFQVIELNDLSGSTWQTIQYLTIDGPILLSAAGPDGNVYNRWRALPESFKKRFTFIDKKTDKEPFPSGALLNQEMITDFGCAGDPVPDTLGPWCRKYQDNQAPKKKRNSRRKLSH